MNRHLFPTYVLLFPQIISSLRSGTYFYVVPTVFMAVIYIYYKCSYILIKYVFTFCYRTGGTSTCNILLSNQTLGQNIIFVTNERDTLECGLSMEITSYSKFSNSD